MARICVCHACLMVFSGTCRSNLFWLMVFGVWWRLCLLEYGGVRLKSYQKYLNHGEW